MASIDHLSRWLVIGFTAAVSGCSTIQETNQAVVGSSVLLGHTPTTNIGQTYYLGVFDPREQLPPTIYRIRVQGQASALSSTQFASGWVRADLVDSLSGRVNLDKGQISQSEDKDSQIRLNEDRNELNRRLVMFGPEGFREAPKDHRLVIVMGSSPQTFFGAIDQALGVVAGVTQPSNAGPDVARAILTDLSRMREERRATQTVLDLLGKE
jgi:hypothetical protein